MKFGPIKIAVLVASVLTLASCTTSNVDTRSNVDKKRIVKTEKVKKTSKAKKGLSFKERRELAIKKYKARVEKRRAKYSHPKNTDKPSLGVKHKRKGKVKSVKKSATKRKCYVSGATKGLHKSIRYRLCLLSRHFGKTVTVTSGCRKKGSRSAPKSWHRRKVGCRAADIRIKGVSKYAIANWHVRNFKSGGTGTYTCSPAHIDTRPGKVSWHWKQKC